MYCLIEENPRVGDAVMGTGYDTDYNYPNIYGDPSQVVQLSKIASIFDSRYSENQITLSPNPASSFTKSAKEFKSYKIYDSQGNTLITSFGDMINTQNFSAGVYYLVGQDIEGKFWKGKFVVRN